VDVRTAADLMRRRVISLAPEEPLRSAGEMMRLGRLRQVPVVRDGTLVGELSYRDACLALRDLVAEAARASRRPGPADAVGMRAHAVSEVMAPAGEAVGPDDPLGRVAAHIARRGTGFVPVVEPRSGQLLGVVTERDLLLAAFDSPRTPGEAPPSGRSAPRRAGRGSRRRGAGRSP